MSHALKKYFIWLESVLVLVLVYALLLVFAGSVAGALFEWFGFGPDDSIQSSEVDAYLRLPYMVLGAVMAGWSNRCCWSWRWNRCDGAVASATGRA